MTHIDHPLRISLASEVHSRPFLALDVTADRAVTVTHLALFSGTELDKHSGFLSSLCLHFGVAPPSEQAKHFFHDFGPFRLKWENHTEFSTFTFASATTVADLDTAQRPLDHFAQMPTRHIPQQWWQSLAGTLLAATHVTLLKGPPHGEVANGIRQQFTGSLVVGSHVLHGGEVWTDFQIQPDGFGRFLVFDNDLREQQAGRLVQRLLEIDTYRMMALMALPRALESGPTIRQLEQQLVKLTKDLVQPNTQTDEAQLLHDLSDLAAQVEVTAQSNSYRFSAAQAYYKIVVSRISELREERIEGVPTIGEFMQRRLMPAMETCQSVANRQENLAQRVSRANDLLRTRVGISQEQQNRNILQSLNQRAATQLRLQQAVEGLSTVAISYYLLGILHHGFDALHEAGYSLNPTVATGLAVPFVLGVVWFVLHRLRKQAIHDDNLP